MAKSKDLFDDSVMSFGEHLEVLRIHLWKSIIGLFICVTFTLFFADSIIAVIRKPIDEALFKHNVPVQEGEDNLSEFGFGDFWRHLKSYLTGNPEEEPDSAQSAEDGGVGEDGNTAEEVDIAATDFIGEDDGTISLKIEKSELARAVAEILPKSDSDVLKNVTSNRGAETLTLRVAAREFVQLKQQLAFHQAELQRISDMQNKPVVLTVQEAFMTYLKVAFVSGFVLSSPWVFYQIWLFVAAGLYPNERRYVNVYLPFSIVLFIGGVLFCFFAVFPFVLQFLLGFAGMLEAEAQIRLSEWISFAITLPVMFGLSFQLPLVMLFLERISLFEAADYRQKRRMAVLVIAILSMFLTPADPMSMLMMFFPLLFLYELGIFLCRISPGTNPYPSPTT